MNSVYTIEKYSFENWNLITYPEYFSYVQANKATELKQIIRYCEVKELDQAFKWFVEIGTMQFLVGVFPKERSIRLCSKNLNLELAMATIDEEDQRLSGIREHSLQVAQLSLNDSPTLIEFLSFTYDLPLFDTEEFEAVHAQEQLIAKDLIAQIKKYRQSPLEKISDFGLDLTANFMLIRIHLLKFLAILPNLDHDKDGHEVKRIFLETLRRLITDSYLARERGLKGQKRALPYFYILGFKFCSRLAKVVPAGILALVIRKSVATMAKRFIAGENIRSAKKALADLHRSHRQATIDQLGELVVSNNEADEYLEKVLDIIDGINDGIIKGERNSAGLNLAHVSIKVSALSHDFKPQDLHYTYEQVAPRLIKILLAAKENEVFVNIDAEHFHFRDIVFKIFKKALLETDELKDYADTGIVVQAYLRDGYKHLLDIIKLAEERQLPMPIRLVKGAYWDAETVEADAHNFSAPQFLNKEETDIHFRQLVYFALKEHQFLKVCIASHNIQDHSFAEAVRMKMFPTAPIIEHQCLHMTYEGLSVGMAKLNWPTRNYIPVGDLLVGMAYLVRRIMENSSQVGVLTIMRSHKKSLNFTTPTEKIADKKAKNEYENDPALNLMTEEFRNIYPIRTYLKPHFKRVKKALKSDLNQLQDNKMFRHEGDTKIFSNSYSALKIGEVSYDQAEQVNTKIERLFQGYKLKRWSDDRVARYSSLFRLADLMLFHRESLSSLIMIEAGKTIDEAIADVDEAIDFVQFYIREQVKIDQTDLYAERGVIGVIAPWNFPLAIPCGMTVAALTAGNTVILKPAEQTPLIALKFLELAREAGISGEVLEVSLGEAEVGKAIVDHPLVTGIVFTGSKSVGEIIYKKIKAEKTDAAYPYLPESKFAITEMGGKNAIIVTNNSELDETVAGIIYAAFAHAGQKCSAASRVIIDNQIKEAFLKRFIRAIQDIKVGPATSFSTTINPLIATEDQARVRSMARRARQECLELGGVVHIDRSQEEYINCCVGPSLFELPAKAVLNQKTVASEEVFGPLIHLIGYDSKEEALKLFNSTEYALTGGIYCQSQDDLDYFLPQLEAGNIYVNRPNTGARVAIEPFGGFKKSGTGPKAGGRSYLYQFNRLKKPYQLAPMKFEKESESNQIPFIAYGSGLDFPRRLYSVRQVTNSLLRQFEVYFGILSGEEKEKIELFKQKLVLGEFNLDERETYNRLIPGQINLNKNNMGLGKGLVIDNSERPDVQLILDLLVNLAIGNGMTVLTSSEFAHGRWQEFAKLCYLKGISSYNFSISKVGKQSFEALLEQGDFDFILSHHPFEKGDLDRILSRNKLTKIFYTGERVDFDQAIDSFTHTRAFAINTMRHGAPLELTLE